MIVRITRGDPTAEEVAAVALVLALRSTSTDRGPEVLRRGPASRRYARWKRLERLPRYAAPGSWRHRD